jgi:type IV fimbrial biogenesis protein FimT
MSTRRNNSGFSLLELLVALTIGAMVMTMAVPSFQNSIANQRMVSANNDMVMALTLAKSEAIKRVSYVTVCASSNGTSCAGNATSWDDGWLVFANAGTTTIGALDAGDELIRVYPGLPESLSLSPRGSISSFLSFRPGGTMGTNTANMNGTLTSCDFRGVDEASAILLEASGRWQISHSLAHDASALTCPEV